MEEIEGMEVFTLIARKKNVALVFVSYLLVALAAISLLTICIGFVPGILFAVVFGLVAYLMIMAQNTEFEYSYFDGELRFAKIKNKSRRKRLGIYRGDEDKQLHQHEDEKTDMNLSKSDERIAQIREIALNGLQDYANDVDCEAYQFYKKIWLTECY